MMEGAVCEWSEAMAVTEIVQGLHALPVIHVNAFLLDGPDGLALIDAGLPGREDVILGALRGLGRAPGDLRHIVPIGSST